MFDRVLAYCKAEQSHRDPASANMWAEDWETRHNTLPYLLLNTSRFSYPAGKFFILVADNEIIGCSGAYIAEFSPKVAMLGARTWVSRQHRSKHLVRNYLLPAQRSWAIDNNIEVVALSFNEYNKNLIKVFEKGQQQLMRTDINIFYKNFNILDFPVTIQGVPQWVIFENLHNYVYNWAEIRHI